MVDQWVVGFLRRKNDEVHFSYETHERGYLESLDYESIVKNVSNYCDNNPLAQLNNAVNNLNHERMQRNLSRQQAHNHPSLGDILCFAALKTQNMPLLRAVTGSKGEFHAK